MIIIIFAHMPLLFWQYLLTTFSGFSKFYFLFSSLVWVLRPLFVPQKKEIMIRRKLVNSTAAVLYIMTEIPQLVLRNISNSRSEDQSVKFCRLLDCWIKLFHVWAVLEKEQQKKYTILYKHGGGGVMVWECSDGYVVADYQHSMLQQHVFLSSFVFNGTRICFSTVITTRAPFGFNKEKKCCITWPGLTWSPQSPDLTHKSYPYTPTPSRCPCSFCHLWDIELASRNTRSLDKTCWESHITLANAF